MPKANDPDNYAMSFGDHLDELRRRLIHAAIGVGVACGLTFYYAQDLVAWLVVPLAHAQRSAGLPVQTIAVSVMTGFSLYMKVGLIAGLIVASPWVVYQIWKFVSAGLYASEQRIAYLLAPFSAIMSLFGVLFLYYIMLPLALMFLIQFAVTYQPPSTTSPMFIERMMDQMPAWTREAIDMMNGVTSQTRGSETQPAAPSPATPSQAPPLILPVLGEDPGSPADGQAWIKVPENELRVMHDGRVRVAALSVPSLINPMIEINEYIDFVGFMMLAVVISFQLPVIMVIVGWTGLVAPAMIARSRKYFVFICFVAAAFLTPTSDPFNLTIMALPLWMLFEIGLISMRLSYRSRGHTSNPEGDGST